MWRIYKVLFAKPVDKELVAEIDFLNINLKNDSHLEILFALTKEGWKKSIIQDFHSKKKALDRFYIAATILSEPTLEIIRKQLKNLSPKVKISLEQIQEVIGNEVLKRELLEGERAQEAHKRIARSLNNVNRSKTANVLQNTPAQDNMINEAVIPKVIEEPKN